MSCTFTPQRSRFTPQFPAPVARACPAFTNEPGGCHQDNRLRTLQSTPQHGLGVMRLCEYLSLLMSEVHQGCTFSTPHTCVSALVHCEHVKVQQPCTVESMGHFLQHPGTHPCSAAHGPNCVLWVYYRKQATAVRNSSPATRVSTTGKYPCTPWLSERMFAMCWSKKKRTACQCAHMHMPAPA